MSAEQLSSVAAVALSLLFAYVPGLKEWFDAREGTQKAGIMALFMVAIAAGAFALSCGQLIPEITCDKAGALALASNLIAALIANQGAYTLLVRPFKPQAFTLDPGAAGRGFHG